MPPLTGRDVWPAGALCSECGLSNCPFVPSEGPKTAKIVLIGEGPGYYEMIDRRPFVGPSGQILEKALKSAGLRRQDVFITNAVLCRPPENRDPEPEEVKCCNPRLRAELREIQPKAIVVLGAWAYYALTGKKTFGKVRGTLLNVDGYTVIPTHHPARCLRQPNLYPELESAIRLAARVATEALEQPGWPGEVQLREVEAVIVNDAEQARRTPFWNGGTGTLAVDVETGSQGQLLSVAIAVDPDRAYVFTEQALQDEEVKLGLSLVLGNARVIGHNLKYDAQVLWRNGIDCRIDGDTMLLNYVKEFRPGVNALKPLANAYFAAGNYDADIEPYYRKGMEHAPRNLLYDYNAKDAAYTYRLFKILEPEVGEHPVYKNLLLPAYPILARMEYIGVRIDRERIPKLREELQRQAEEQRVVLREYAGLPDFNPSSPRQVAVLLYDVLGLPDVTGKRKTDKPTLEMLPEHPAVQALLEYRRVTKLISTYVDAIEARLDPEDRLHGQFHLHTTETGRLSSSNPNLQNIPKRQGSLIRDLFVATPGYTMIELDYSNAELRTVTWLADEPAMRKAFEERVDLHRYTASLIFGVPMDEVTDEQRQIAKTVNFAVLYGAQPPKIAQTAGISVNEAAEVIDGWFRAYPKIGQWLDAVHREVQEKGYLETFLGRRRVFPVITPQNRDEVLRQAGNFPVQSIASDMTLISLIRIGQKLDWNDTRLLLTIHDALVLETREDPYLVALAAKRIMEEVPRSVGIDVPFEVEVKAGARWGSLEEMSLEEVVQA